MASSRDHKDILELATQLRQERLFISAERQSLQDLNKKVEIALETLSHLAWVSHQERVNLDALILSRPGSSPSLCCQRAYALENAVFIDSYRQIGFRASAYGDFLQQLKSRPRLVAECLAAGEKVFPELMPSVATSVLAGLYGNGLLHTDENLVLQLLSYLMQLQLATSVSPRKLLRGSCAFGCLYKAFHEGLFSVQLFLTAALHEPIMHLLMEDDASLNLELDDSSFNLEEGASAISSTRGLVIEKLVSFTRKFIEGIVCSLSCFPPSIAWLIREMRTLLVNNEQVEIREVTALCVELLFGLLICPAIINPEPLGIIEAPISEVARSNLMRVAQILQALAVWKYENIDPRWTEVCSRVDKDSVASILENVLENNSEKFSSMSDKPLEGLQRTAILITESELQQLVSFLRTVLDSGCESLDRIALETMLASLPPLLTSQISLSPSASVANGLTASETSPSTSAKKNILGRVRVKGKNNFLSPTSPSDENGTHLDDDEHCGENILVFPLPANSTCVGLLSEQEVLAREENIPRPSTDTENNNDEEDVPVLIPNGNGETQEKRTRFSLSHDEGSIGNTSDNLEAISEAASNHSVASSVESENDDDNDANDNLSDMVSANVSGRGSPNVSGRDTPSSQVTEGDEGTARGPTEERRTIMNAQLSKPSDIDDRFGRFEVKDMIQGDETVSMISDSWSTDVLGSEMDVMADAADRTGRPPLEGIVLPGQHLLLEREGGLFDVSETASEAWSTDVMASDTERLGELDNVDTDDANSVTRSDDAARSETDADPVLDGSEGREMSAIRVRGRLTGVLFRPIRERETMYGEPYRSAESNSPQRAGSGGSTRSSHLSPKRIPGFATGMEERRRSEPSAVRFLTEFPGTLGPVDEGRSQDINNPAGMKHPSTTSLSSSSSSSSNSSHSSRGSITSSVGSSAKGMQDRAVQAAQAEALRKKESQDEPASSASALTHELARTAMVPMSASTGAIPKSISFDKSADRGDKEHYDEEGKKRGFFRGFRLPFKRPGRKGGRQLEDKMSERPDATDLPTGRLRRSMSEDTRNLPIETTDDILAKYRSKVPADLTVDSNGHRQDGGAEGLNGDAHMLEEEDDRVFIDPKNVEGSYAFQDAKRKLRLVLSNADVYSIPPMRLQHRGGEEHHLETALLNFLKLQLAEAINLHDRSLVAQLHEAVRCIGLFDKHACLKLFKTMEEDLKNRTAYTAYLIRCRQSLLSTLAHLERLTQRVEQDRSICHRFLVSLCVRDFLKPREKLLSEFVTRFISLSMADEKADLVESFLHKLTLAVESDCIWQSASPVQIKMAKLAIEQEIMSKIYTQALYPNGDGDISRDQVLYEHLNRLSQIVTPSHKDLRIPKSYRYECPWPSAQAELYSISAYKTPREKVSCIVRCASTVMYLLSLASERGVPAADDFIPVFVFVLIKANPSSLLSTVQYVDSFYGKRLHGEEQYWWTQFCSAIEFVKTMD